MLEPWIQALDAELHARRAELPGRKPNLRRTRGRIAVVTDAACALPVDPATGRLQLGLLGEQVEVVPIPVMIETGPRSEIYPEASPELVRDLPLALAQGLPVRTSRPSPGRIAETYQQLHREGFAAVVSVHLAASLSGTCDAARLAADQAALPVTVLDSQQAGLALGQAVIQAALSARLGGSQEQVATAAQAAAASSYSVFAVPSLEQLRRGGRINPLASLFGTMIRIKPVLQLRAGEIQLLERAHSMQRASARMIALAAERAADVDRALIGVQCCGNPEQAAELAQALQPHSAQPVSVVELPPGLAAHLGLGALGVCVTSAVPHSPNT